MHGQTKRRIDLTANVADGVLAWDVPQGPWKVMIFSGIADGGRVGV